MFVHYGVITYDMELHTPLDLDQGRRCQTLEAVQNTVEEAPRKVYCGDTASDCANIKIESKSKQYFSQCKHLCKWTMKGSPKDIL